MADFSEGDLARLKSGGPVMTVSSQEDDGFGTMLVYCSWFDEKHIEKNGSFRPGMLEKIDPNAPRSSGGPKGSWMGN